MSLEGAPLVFAGFWRRFGALWIDVFILLPLILPTMWLNRQSQTWRLVLYVFWVIFSFLYEVYWVKGWGGTPGKLLVRIKIVKADGDPVGYKEVVWRYAPGGILSAVSSTGLLIGALSLSADEFAASTETQIAALAPAWHGVIEIIWNVWIWSEALIVLTNKKRRALHDFIAGTVVVRA